MTIIIGLAALLALCYGLGFAHRGISWPRSLIKTGSTVLLALIALTTGAPWLLTAGLALGAAGDFFLTRPGERNFLAGLGAFLAGHIAYVALFAAISDFARLTESGIRLAIAALLIAAAAAVYRQLWPHLGALRIPVAAYVVTICAMGIAALTLPFIWPLALAVAGAFAFILSDMLLSQQLFVVDEGTALSHTLGLALWFTYWPAQALILAAFIPVI